MFDGIGGFPYAASFYGITPIWASEILPSAVQVTRRHFPDMEHVGDITRLDGRKLPPVDILTFGSPCQGLSMAGQRLGLADARSGLFTEAIRIIREMQEVTHGEYPKIALWENVPGALSSAGGRDFEAVLQAFTAAKIPMPYSGRWANAGMVRGRGVDLAWCVYDAQYFGTAQRRRRVFLVADFRARRAGEILFVPKSLRGYFEAGGTPRQGLAAFAENRIGEAGRELNNCPLLVYENHSQDTRYKGPLSVAPTVSATYGMGGNNQPFVVGRLKGINILNDQGGAALTVERKEVSPTLRSQTHGNLPVVAMGFDLQQITSKANRSALKPVQPALCGSGNPHVICMATGQANASILEDASPTLTHAHERPIVMYPELSGTLCASGAGLSRPAGMASETDFCIVEAGEAWESLVRRLTPVECERLQGFPDGWTEYGADGRPISDTNRYQMLGNSVAVPCVAYIMQGIVGAMEMR